MFERLLREHIVDVHKICDFLRTEVLLMFVLEAMHCRSWISPILWCMYRQYYVYSTMSVFVCVAYILFAGHTIDCWPRLKVTQKQRDPRPLAITEDEWNAIGYKRWRISSWFALFVDPPQEAVWYHWPYVKAMEDLSSRRIYHTSPHPLESSRAVVKK